MNSSRTTVTSGIVGVILAVSLIAIALSSGVPAVRFLTTSNGETPGSTSSTTTGANAGTSTPSVTTGTASAGQGTLSILMSDPPKVPAGVTAVYISYGGLAVHGENGWTIMKSSGEVELLGTVNFAQTLSSANLPGGTYDAVEFDVTSAEVTFAGANHTAVVQGSHLVVHIVGDAVVSGSQSSAAIIDIQPTVVNVGSSSNPSFVLWTVAKAFPVPMTQVSGNIGAEGHRLSLAGMSWWENDRATANASLQVSGVALSSSSLSLSVKDNGTSDTWLKMVVVTQANASASGMEGDEVPTAVTGSAVFVVLQNGTLVQFTPLTYMGSLSIRGESQSSVFDALTMAGYNLTAGSTVKLAYSGDIGLGFGLLTPIQGIAPGTSYWVTVIGLNTVARVLVTSS